MERETAFLTGSCWQGHMKRHGIWGEGSGSGWSEQGTGASGVTALCQGPNGSGDAGPHGDGGGGDGG